MTISDEATEAALFKVASIHHIHGIACLCGFKSLVSRDRTKHIMDAAAPIIRADAKAEALEEAADEMDRLERIGDIPFRVSDEEEAAYATYVHHPDMRSWLRDRAAELRNP